MATGVRVEGLKQTTRALERLGRSADDIKAMNTTIAAPVVAEAKSLTPSRTGALIASIRNNKAKNKIVLKAGSKKVNYASYVEYGAAHNTAVQMLTRAISGRTAWVVNQLERELERLSQQV